MLGDCFQKFLTQHIHYSTCCRAKCVHAPKVVGTAGRSAPTNSVVDHIPMTVISCHNASVLQNQLVKVVISIPERFDNQYKRILAILTIILPIQAQLGR